MAQKIIKIGSSVGITLPQHALEALGVKAGDTVTVEHFPGRKVVIISAKTDKQVILSRDEEFLYWAKNFILRYGDALKALANEPDEDSKKI